MRNNLLLPILFISFVFFACSGNKDKVENAGMKSDNNQTPASQIANTSESNDGSGEPLPNPMEQKLIKNGQVSFKVKSLFDTKENIKKILSTYNGYIAKENSFGAKENPSENLTIRISNKTFDIFLEQVLAGAEEIESKNIDIEDVTAQFVDIETRLKNKKQLEKKYQELLAKATNMDDILKIEKEINIIREDVEACEGRLKYLSNQVTYSTITIHYFEQRTSGFNLGGKLGRAVSSGGYVFLEFIIIVVNLWPLWALGGLIWFLIVKTIKRTKSKNTKQ